MKQLFIWEGVLTDYYPGMVVVLADSLSQARELAAETTNYNYPVSYFKENLPHIYKTDRKKPVCHLVHGGG